MSELPPPGPLQLTGLHFGVTSYSCEPSHPRAGNPGHKLPFLLSKLPGRTLGFCL